MPHQRQTSNKDQKESDRLFQYKHSKFPKVFIPFTVYF